MGCCGGDGDGLLAVVECQTCSFSVSFVRNSNATAYLLQVVLSIDRKMISFTEISPLFDLYIFLFNSLSLLNAGWLTFMIFVDTVIMYKLNVLVHAAMDRLGLPGERFNITLNPAG